VASRVTPTPFQIALEEDHPVLPLRLFRDELKRLAPARFVMADYLLSDLAERAPELSEQEQVHELMIVILSSLVPHFPSTRVLRPLDS